MPKCKCKKKKPPRPGIAEWVVTYGDLMTLLLCFFILLAAFSELKRDEEFRIIAQTLMEAFGFVTAAGEIPARDPHLQSLVTLLEQATTTQHPEMKISQSDVDGMAGRHTTVKTVREGLVFTIGGSNTFDRESAHLKDPVKDDLRAIAELIGGRNNKIAIRGHADAKRFEPGSGWRHSWHLGWARAEQVALFLTEEVGMRQELFRIESAGDTEPVVARARQEPHGQVNRRVEIILTETLVEELNPDAHFTDPDRARGG